MATIKLNARDRIVTAALSKQSEIIRADFDDIEKNPGLLQSPIEVLFFQCLQAHMICFQDNPTIFASRDIPVSKKLFVTHGVAVCLCQVTLLDWPVDFAFYARRYSTGGISILAIECDGHEFHERTPGQAARDRSRDRRLQEAGITVMRFTGSELHRNAWGCFAEVLRWVDEHTQPI